MLLKVNHSNIRSGFILDTINTHVAVSLAKLSQVEPSWKQTVDFCTARTSVHIQVELKTFFWISLAAFVGSVDDCMHKTYTSEEISALALGIMHLGKFWAVDKLVGCDYQYVKYFSVKYGAIIMHPTIM